MRKAEDMVSPAISMPTGLGIHQTSCYRLPVILHQCRHFTPSSALQIAVSPVLNAEPTKKKKRVDTGLLVQKEIKRKTRLEKSIKKLELKGRILKPIEEIDGNRHFLKTLESRTRDVPQLSFEESERRALLTKEWHRYKTKQYSDEIRAIDRALEARDRALQELRAESEELYLEAIKIDASLIPYERRGPTRTPPIKGYVPPDGDVTNTTRAFEGEKLDKSIPLIE